MRAIDHGKRESVGKNNPAKNSLQGKESFPSAFPEKIPSLVGKNLSRACRQHPWDVARVGLDHVRYGHRTDVDNVY